MDEKGNKPYWVVRDDHSDFVKKKFGPVGTQVPLPGREEMKTVLTLLGDPNPDAIEGASIAYKDGTITVVAFPSLQGKKLKIALHQEENEYNGNISIRNYVYGFMDEDGKDVDGSDLKSKAEKYFQKKPLKELKKSGTTAGTTTAAPAAQADLTNAGW